MLVITTPRQGVLPKPFVLAFFPVRDGFHYKFWVYILVSRSGTLYVGITGYLDRRIMQHKMDSIEGFTNKYKVHRLVYYETYDQVQRALGREKQLKGWRREKKIALIEKMNPRWQDLAENWGREMRFPGTASPENSLTQHGRIKILGILRSSLDCARDFACGFPPSTRKPRVLGPRPRPQNGSTLTPRPSVNQANRIVVVLRSGRQR
jgi:putative endonuclease